MDTVDRFRTAVEQRDAEGLEPLFAPEPRFFSPVKFTPFEGRTAVLGVFGVLLRVFDEFRYVGELHGTAETAAGAPADTHQLIFRAVVGSKQIHGIDLIQLDDDGLIEEFTVMVRPMSAVAALGEAVQAGLVAEGLVAGGS
ncbi:nuclear transport factor 2 family protein [Saccharopolyspora indica]|uniref:nuclear transport factor 2 family protein n=1 Tax=Saccharopolyspora indica TaxID=1229659 RepID=UPI0022EA4524|nr:nuclear transport factor 2 family protein [Saccharopolyspora indica]MDA3642645.1 nuclear transport factor 2 family protein [Saccharopolyspora indica]